MKHASEQLTWAAYLVTAILLTLVPAYVATSAESDNVHFYGALVEEPCVVAPGAEEIQLDFGTIVDKYLYQNQRTTGQSFSLHLLECDLSIGKTVAVTFLGSENLSLPGLLMVDSGSESKGIAIGLETVKGKFLPINAVSGKYALLEGGNEITLKAYVQGEPNALAGKMIERGPFSAIATFSLEYE